jgi:hypothetical protein
MSARSANGTFGWVVRLCLKNLAVVCANRDREQILMVRKQGWMGATSVIISNPHSNPQCMMSRETSACLAVPAVL